MADKTKYFDYDTVKEMLYDLEYEGKDVDPTDYPFIEIADEHGDLIDRDALRSVLSEDLKQRDSNMFTSRGISRMLEESAVVLERTT